MHDPILETERLYLRRFSLEDAPFLQELNSHPEVVRYVGDPLPWHTLEQAEHVLRELILPQYVLGIGRWAVHLKANQACMGWCGLKKVQEGYDLGYRYLPSYWGNGYATEAARAVLDYGTRVLALPGILGRSDVRNTASIRVLRKLKPASEGPYTDTETGRHTILFRYT